MIRDETASRAGGGGGGGPLECGRLGKGPRCTLRRLYMNRLNLW